MIFVFFVHIKLFVLTFAHSLIFVFLQYIFSKLFYKYQFLVFVIQENPLLLFSIYFIYIQFYFFILLVLNKTPTALYLKD